MSLKTKIIIGFLLSSFIIAILAIFAYLNFIEISREIRYLELSDTLRSKSLQLRRHEKNFFLYRDLKEIKSVYDYLNQLRRILRDSEYLDNRRKLLSLLRKIEEYERRFNEIEIIFWDIQKEFDRLKSSKPQYAVFFPLIESTFLERPLVNAELMERIFLLRSENSLLKNLRELDVQIKTLRKDGEEILTISKDLDKSARENVERVINMSQTSLLILLPLFFLVGLMALFAISQSVVKRLKLLTTAVEKTGMGDFLSMSIPEGHDEVGQLMASFNKMNFDLIARDKELRKKNDELLHSRKLASIGTLASGVAHELNNPLNNIYLSAQVLAKEIDYDHCPPMVKETVGDIFSQTLRVKRIVSDLLEFSREKSLEIETVDVVFLVKDVLNQMAASGELNALKYDIKAAEDIKVNADSHLLRQVFINLFSNAIDAMDHGGSLYVEIDLTDTSVRIKVSDTGKGIVADDLQRLFDPFFTTKEKGTGLGLAIVYNIVKKHDGTITVDSEAGKGTTFTITLPR